MSTERWTVGETAPDLRGTFPATIRDEHGWGVAAVFAYPRSTKRPELLAAAPQLHAALEAFVTAFGEDASTRLSGVDLHIELIEARAALRAAAGLT